MKKIQFFAKICIFSPEWGSEFRKHFKGFSDLISYPPIMTCSHFRLKFVKSSFFEKIHFLSWNCLPLLRAFSGIVESKMLQILWYMCQKAPGSCIWLALYSNLSQLQYYHRRWHRKVCTSQNSQPPPITRRFGDTLFIIVLNDSKHILESSFGPETLFIIKQRRSYIDRRK